MSTTVKVQIQQRIDTASAWTTANPTLLAGEVGWESDTKKYKIGDGSTAWASLAYAPGSGGYTAGTGVSISGSNVITASAVALTTVQTAANETAHLALTTQEGDVVVRSDENKSYVRNSGTAGSMADFTLLATPTDAVLSVNGNTGAITAAQIAAAVEAASDSNTFTDADHTKLNGIEAGATGDQTNAEIRSAVEAASDSNVFTDADHTKLNGIATGAEVNVQSDWNASSGDAQILNKPTIPTDTNTTYAISCVDGDNTDEEKIRLTAGGSGSGTDDIVLEAGTGLSIARSSDKITFTNTVSNTDTQLTEEQVEDFVGGMLTGNTETGITVTYQDADGTIDFVVDTQTDNNFTTTLKNKLDGIAASANNYSISTDLLDEDNFATNSASKPPSQQSVKAYVDTADALKANLSGATFSGLLTVENALPKIKLIDSDATGTPEAMIDGSGGDLYLEVDKDDEKGSSIFGVKIDGTTALTLDSSQNATFAGTITGAASSGALSIPANGDIRIANGTWSGETAGKIQHNSNWLYIQGGTSGIKFRSSSGTNTLEADSSGNATFTGTVSDSKGDLRSIPQNTQGSAYELLAADAGKHILASGNITWVDSRHAAGDAITIVNNTAGNITITKGTTMYNTADGSNANRTLATRGMATILWASSTVAYISGAGLS